jgi:rubrerythrin
MYADLAAKQENPAVKDELMALSQMEADHAEMFVKMRRQLPEDMRTAVFDPNDQAALYLQAIADSSIAEGSPEVAAMMTGKESFKDVLKLAVELEKQAILFYLGIKDMVPERLGKDMVERIIKEEQSHVVMLSNRLGR